MGPDRDRTLERVPSSRSDEIEWELTPTTAELLNSWLKIYMFEIQEDEASALDGASPVHQEAIPK